MTRATKIAVLKDGVLSNSDRRGDLQQPANMFVADFMGSPAMNLLKAQIETAGSQVSVTLERECRTLRLAVPQNGALSAYAGKGVVLASVRKRSPIPDGADRNAQFVAEGECLIEVVEPAGSDTFAVTSSAARKSSKAQGRCAHCAGTDVRLAFNLDKAVFFDRKAKKRIA